MGFRVDLHTHTRYGSSCSYMEPGDLVRRAAEVGLDAVCITEHNSSWDEGQLRSLGNEGRLVVLGGIEVSTELGDVLVYGVDGLGGGGWKIADLRRRVDEASGRMVAAHPLRAYFLSAPPDNEGAMRNPLLEWVDAVEVFNGMASAGELRLGMAVASERGMKGTGGSDSHAPHTLGWCYTEFERRIKSSAELVAELKSGRFRAVHELSGLTF